MRVKTVIITILCIVFLGGNAFAVEHEISDLKRHTIEAFRKAKSSARLLEQEMAKLLPDVQGWNCTRTPLRAEHSKFAVAALARANFDCTQAPQRLGLTITVGRDAAKANCDYIHSTRQGIEAGHISGKLIRFFVNKNWQVMRSGIGFSACSEAGVAISTSPSITNEAIESGPARVDEFAEKILSIDPTEVLNSNGYTNHDRALAEFMSRTAEQAELLQTYLPVELFRGAGGKIKTVPSPEISFLPKAIILTEVPSVATTLTFPDCTISIGLTASPRVIAEQTNSGALRFDKDRIHDGEVRYAYRYRNTPRFFGRESVDGSKVSVLVDNSVLVSVATHGTRRCDNHTKQVNALFVSILSHDFSIFGFQPVSK